MATSEKDLDCGETMLRAIDHVQLAMPEGQEIAARRFYGDVLGLTEVAKPDNLAKRGGGWFENETVKVHLGVMQDFRPATKAHPAFLVDDLNVLRARCDVAGAICIDDQPLEGFARCYVLDPFGNRIALKERL